MDSGHRKVPETPFVLNVMARNAEVIRQWNILREIESSRGATIRQLSTLTGVTTRTIRRDLDALQDAGFPIYDEAGDGRKIWKLDTRPFRRLDDTAFTLPELSALYFSRTLVECLAGTPFQPDLSTAFAKLEAALGPRTRQFLDRMPAVIQAKREPGRVQDDAVQRRTIGRLLDAILQLRRIEMRYHSFSSRRERTYTVEPHRLVYAHGALYLFAYVPAYAQPRTFAVERIQRLTSLDETFEPRADLGEAAFPHSLGIHQGAPERVELQFTPEAAPYVEERVWHPSQSVRRLKDGSLHMELDVCTDGALRSWILGFGPTARVRAPRHLADRVAGEVAATHRLYTSG
jgi:predicted DNA-binding transcriptional regulator YafY